jgi:hypothetical protein
MVCLDRWCPVPGFVRPAALEVRVHTDPRLFAEQRRTGLSRFVHLGVPEYTKLDNPDEGRGPGVIGHIESSHLRALKTQPPKTKHSFCPMSQRLAAVGLVSKRMRRTTRYVSGIHSAPNWLGPAR